ncbi:Acetyltransferase (GNAT) family protein [Natronoarchaeum philippinense]|uniref:Acetyltransferase (GNAT) family protein n=1 Tax=Natronoarchaeum philippinense TaxID=558529 RepID=A0A285P3T3_NATPI|nr:GNAT family N-acetyltransferase [Natronoarchaeum philippinense]SNZ14816.1 Acetyltransferase (GNAT) family protein [Natronoarchaeum philippinense]
MDVRELDAEAERREAVPILRQLWPDADPKEIIDWTGEEEYHLFGRFDGDDIVGVAGVQLGNHLHHARIAWLYDLVVDEPRRGGGHGTALLEHVEAWVTQQDCEYVALANPLGGGAVHEYYENRDYEKWGYVIEKEL